MPQQRKCESTIWKLCDYGSLNHNKSAGNYSWGGRNGRWPPAVPATTKTSALPEETGDLIAARSAFSSRRHKQSPNPCLFFDFGWFEGRINHLCLPCHMGCSKEMASWKRPASCGKANLFALPPILKSSGSVPFLQIHLQIHLHTFVVYHTCKICTLLH